MCFCLKLIIKEPFRADSNSYLKQNPLSNLCRWFLLKRTAKQEVRFNRCVFTCYTWDQVEMKKKKKSQESREAGRTHGSTANVMCAFIPVCDGTLYVRMPPRAFPALRWRSSFDGWSFSSACSCLMNPAVHVLIECVLWFQVCPPPHFDHPPLPSPVLLSPFPSLHPSMLLCARQDADAWWMKGAFTFHSSYEAWRERKQTTAL